MKKRLTKQNFNQILHNQKGEIDGVLITGISLFLAAILMFIVPLLAVAERNDDISQSVVQSQASEYIDKIVNKGKIDENDYNEFVQKIEATGNTFDIQIEVQHLDENYGKKATITSEDLIGENQRYSTFTTEVLNKLDELGKYPLKKGDIVIITVKNTNKTMAQSLRTFAYKVTGKNVSAIVASVSGMVLNSGT